MNEELISKILTTKCVIKHYDVPKGHNIIVEWVFLKS